MPDTSDSMFYYVTLLYIFFNPFIANVAEQQLVLRTPLLPSNTTVVEQ